MILPFTLTLTHCYYCVCLAHDFPLSVPELTRLPLLSVCLFSEFMAITYGKYKTPIVAYAVGQGLGFMLCVLGYYYPIIGANMYNVCILSAFIAYISQLMGYIVFKYRFPRQDRKFKSPLGVVG